jgi:hypothetical protein
MTGEVVIEKGGDGSNYSSSLNLDFVLTGGIQDVPRPRRPHGLWARVVLQGPVLLTDLGLPFAFIYVYRR